MCYTCILEMEHLEHIVPRLIVMKNMSEARRADQQIDKSWLDLIFFYSNTKNDERFQVHLNFPNF